MYIAWTLDVYKRQGGDRLCLKPDPQTGVSVEIICAGGISDRGIHADITDY